MPKILTGAFLGRRPAGIGSQLLEGALRSLGIWMKEAQTV